MKWWDRVPCSLFSKYWALRQHLHSPLSFSSSLFSSSISAISVVSSAYLRLLIFLLEILIPACASSSPVFLMSYSAYKLNKQGDNIQPWCTPFPIWNQSVVPCPVLTVASWLNWRRKWQFIPVFLPGESHGQRSLVGYSCKESDGSQRVGHDWATSLFWPAYRFPRGWSVGLVFPSLSEFSTVDSDPYSQRLWHSQ